MQCSVFTFRIRTGTGTQTVSGISDRHTGAFTPEYLMFINGSSERNILWANGTGLYNTCTFNRNIYKASDGATGYSAIGDLPQFSAKICSAGVGTGASGTAALDSLEADAFFGGNIYRKCRINSVGLGTFVLEVTATTVWAFDTDVMCVAWANDGDLTVDYLSAIGNTGSHTGLGSPPRALFANYTGLSTAGSLATGAGGGPVVWGWDTPDGGAFSSAQYIVSQGANYRAQRAGTWNLDLSGSGVQTYGAYTSVWGDADLTSAVLAGGTSGGNSLGIFGTAIRGSSGSFLQPTGTGQQTIETRINAAWVMLVSHGGVSGNSTISTWAEMSQGWTDGANQQQFWIGEQRVGNTLPLYGANLFNDNCLLKFVNATGPNGSSTTFGSQAEFVSLDSAGDLVINWTSVDGIAREVIWIALGTAAEPPPPPPPTDFGCPVSLEG